MVITMLLWSGEWKRQEKLMYVDKILSIDDITRLVRVQAQKYGVARMCLFGSYARNEQTPQSDIDLRIDKGNVKGLEIASLLLDLEDSLQKKVDLLTTGAASESFLKMIRPEEKLIYEAE